MNKYSDISGDDDRRGAHSHNKTDNGWLLAWELVSRWAIVRVQVDKKAQDHLFTDATAAD